MGEKCHNREQGRDDCADDEVREETAHDSRIFGFQWSVCMCNEKNRPIC